MVMSAFRRSIKADTKRSGGRGKRYNFDRYRLPVGIPNAILLVDGQYTDPSPAPEESVMDATGRPVEVKKPYFKARKHKRQVITNGRERYLESVCSAGWNPHNPQPCAGCTAVDQGDKSVSAPSDVAAFTIVHLAVYHRHPLLDRKTGGFVMKREQNGQPGNQPVLVDDECGQRSCNFCRILAGQPIIQDPQAREPFPQYRPQDIQTIFGKRRFMELGKNHLSHLEAWDMTVSSICGNDGAQLVTDGFACPNCNTICIDMGQDPRTDDQIAQAVQAPYPCMRCQRPVLLKEVIACEVCERNNRQPLQFTLFNRILTAFRQGEKTASAMVLQGHNSFAEFAQRVDPQLLGGKTFEQVLTDLAKPYDFAKQYEPKSVREQMEELELQGAAATQQYGGQQMPAYNNAAPGVAPAPGYAPMQPPQQAPAGYPGSPYPNVQPQGQPYTPPQMQPAAPGPAAPPTMAPPNFRR